MLKLFRRFPLLGYFGLAYGLSALALVVIGPPRLADGGSRQLSSILMFPIMVIGVGLAGIAATAAVSGRSGLRELRSRLGRWRVGAGWYATLLIPPLGILVVLGVFQTLVSPVFAPNFLVLGVAAGVVSGFCEEIGWTGFAFPPLRARFGALGGALLLGLLWGLWHLPVVDSMGAASPHGRYWPEFFVSFVALVVAMRLLITWIYCNTGSVLLAQLMHASSTGFLVVLGAARVSPAEESLWYFAYAGLLWLIVGVIVARWGPHLVIAPRSQAPLASAVESTS
jgi:uncharacterized protein